MANVFEFSVKTPIIAAGGTYNFTMLTGPSHAVILSRNLGFLGLSLEADVYADPIVSGGAVGTVFSLDPSLGESSEVVFKSGVTVTSLGTQIAATSFYVGATAQGNSVIGTFAPSGGSGVRRLPPHALSMLQVRNTDTNPQSIIFYLRWYEGPQENPGVT